MTESKRVRALPLAEFLELLGAVADRLMVDGFESESETLRLTAMDMEREAEEKTS
jgi:hypothetical protein